MSFLKRFQTALESLYVPPQNKHYVVAYSGGVDSHVLLYCCSKLKLPVRAVHVHHGLQAVADDWVRHCQTTCEQLSVPLDVVYVDAKQKQGQRESPEESARNARYQAFKNILTEGDCLLTGQHLNDQAETLLLQLFRTATSAGLASMPALKRLGDFLHVRPLLLFSRDEIVQFARQNTLRWVEDPSNEDSLFDRNFVRKSILPLLESRWPQAITQLSTVARLQSNNLSVQEDMAAIDLANVVVMKRSQLTLNTYEVVSLLSIGALKKLSTARLLNVLRYWIIQLANKQPTRNLLEEIATSLIESQQDANPVIIFSDYEFRKYQNQLYLLKKNIVVDNKTRFQWNPAATEALLIPHGKLETIDRVGAGLQKKLYNEILTIGFRQGGESFHPQGRQHSQRLKKLLQEAGVPPWERDAIPLVYFNDELVAVVGLWISRHYVAGENEPGWIINLSRG